MHPRLCEAHRNKKDSEAAVDWPQELRRLWNLIAMFTPHIVLSGFEKQSCCFVDQVGNPLKATNSFVQLVLSKEINWKKINTVPQSMWRASGFVFVKWQRITGRMMPKKTFYIVQIVLLHLSFWTFKASLSRCCPRICQECVEKKVLHHIGPRLLDQYIFYSYHTCTLQIDLSVLSQNLYLQCKVCTKQRGTWWPSE